MRPNVAIIGRGKVGSALKRGLDRAGYQVRTVGKEPNQFLEGVRETAKWADIIILAVPFTAVDDVIREMDDGAVGKILVDVTNLFKPEMIAAVAPKSGAEELQRKVPNANVVKAFNMHFAKNMETGRVANEKVTLFVAGDNQEAKTQVLMMGEEIGFDTVDAGPLLNARLLEALGHLNIQLAFAQKLGTDIGFKLVRASPK
jgi:8-hydroxy-5-deazaflavin:NADPH oxidoreductase